MSHRAKHRRINWTPERHANSHKGKGPVGTPPTTGLARAIKAIDRNPRALPVSAFLRAAPPVPGR